MILLFFFWKYCRATSDSVDSGEKTPRLTNLVCAWQMCSFLQYLCNFIMCFLVEVIIATFKSLIPRMEQKAVKLPVCRLSACCCLAPGNQNRDVFAENSSPWHIYISQNSQTDILPLFPAIPQPGSCKGGCWAPQALGSKAVVLMLGLFLRQSCVLLSRPCIPIYAMCIVTVLEAVTSMCPWVITKVLQQEIGISHSVYACTVDSVRRLVFDVLRRAGIENVGERWMLSNTISAFD